MEIDNDTDMNALPTVGDSECVHDNATTLDHLRICLVHNGLFYLIATHTYRTVLCQQ